MKSKLLFVILAGVLLIATFSVFAQESILDTEAEIIPHGGGEGEMMFYDPNDPSVLFPEDLRSDPICPTVFDTYQGVRVTGTLCQGFESPNVFKVVFKPLTPSGFYGRGCARTAAAIQGCGGIVMTGSNSTAYAYGSGGFYGVWRMSQRANDAWLNFSD